MASISITPTEYYNLVQLTSEIITLGVKDGLVIVQAKIELLQQLGYV